jgi:hypothetical protein
MELLDLQTILTVAFILTATAVIVAIDYVRKHRRVYQPQQIQGLVVNSTPVISATPVIKPQAERTLESAATPVMAVATATRPPVKPRIERESITVEMAPLSPSAPSGGRNAIALPPITIDAALWERLTSSQPKRNLLPAARPASRPLPQQRIPLAFAGTVEAAPKMIENDAPKPSTVHQPGGMIQQPVLEKWIENEKRFTGLVVSIGINDADSSMWHTQGLMQSVGSYFASLLKPKDYCCRTAYDEFLIVCPGEQGAQSQRRLNHIAERLWDYQLRGMAACCILFSWGAVQAQDQPLADAVASATERMREVKRSSPVAQSAPAHRKAV